MQIRGRWSEIEEYWTTAAATKRTGDAQEVVKHEQDAEAC